LVLSSAYKNGTNHGTNYGTPANIMEKFEPKMVAKLHAYQEKMYAWLEEMKDGRTDRDERS
jgi:hypothetical protein